MASSRTASPSRNSVEILEFVASELTYLPTPEQRKAKAAFWARFSDNPLCEPEDISLPLAIQLTGDGRLTRWWGADGFSPWFRNRDEFRQRMEYLSHLALDQLESVLAADIGEKGMAAAKISAAKLIMEVTRRMPSKGGDTAKFLDEKVSQMGPRELEEFISRKVGLLSPVATESIPTPIINKDSE